MSCRLAKSYGFIRLLMNPRLRFPADGFSAFRSCSTATRIRSMSASSSSTNLMAGEDANSGVTVLPAVEDKYGGVMTEISHPMDPSAFSALLQSSLSTWTTQGKKGVWIKLPRQLIGLAEAAVKEGFWFHHAEKDYLMLVYWIPIEGDTIPSNASHRVGIGAFVINHNKEVLVVQEKTGRFQGQGIWKFPTGVVNEGEYIHDGSVREVKEETGVDTEFVQVLAFRQTHKAFFEKSDLFFVCMLKPLSLEINAQETEIEAAQWMPWEEYTKQPFVQNHELLRYMTAICSAKANGDYEGFTPLRVSAPDQQGNLYFNTRDLHSRH
ncbi:nudix hydrolase 2 isoform X1 [Brassica rapa]|uniref:nudix hydrolase 2 isoform X1 n=2 Tax=Brassica campestris TaxID=3711 RepID=UPI0004F151FF|nr:nudix hydrolase 2 isoform X1 [Brassica rapa]